MLQSLLTTSIKIKNERYFQRLRNDHENMSFVQIPIQVECAECSKKHFG